jgi:DNA-binding protein H-NS
MAKSGWKLGSMTVVELVDLRKQVERALHDRIGAEQSELRARIDELSALQSGRANGTVANGSARKARGGGGRRRTHALKGRKVAPKYRGPNGETWTGRGLAPRWLADLEKKGKKRDSFLIDQG